MNRTIDIATLPPRQTTRQYLRKKAWRWFDWDQNFFLKPNDAISKLPLSGNVHDEDVVEALKYLARHLPDTFVDLGANIGLVSMLLAPLVKRVVCVEPNPLICNILRVNLALNCRNFEIREYGLGASDAGATLFVPRGNLGGAFIREANEYSAQQLARKDGYAEFDDANYLTEAVKIRACADALRDIRGADAGATMLVKIDVEGLDSLILRNLLDQWGDLFQASRIAMVFESHDRQSASWLAQQVAGFGYGVYGLRVVRTPGTRQPVVRRVLKLLHGERRSLEFVPLGQLGSAGSADGAVTNFACCPVAFMQATPGAAG